MVNIFDDTLSLLYNHMTRFLHEVPKIEGQVRDLRPGEELELGKTYLERTGFPTVMERAIDERWTSFRLGYRFISDSGVYYTVDGKTYPTSESPYPNDICQVVE